MKIAICCNHSWPHIGGSEKIVQQIAESMNQEFKHDVTIISDSAHKTRIHNNIKIVENPRNVQVFLKMLATFDHVLVYSDYFVYWPHIVANIENIKAKVHIALVGMNYMRSQNRGSKTCFDSFIKEYSRTIARNDIVSPGE